MSEKLKKPPRISEKDLRIYYRVGVFTEPLMQSLIDWQAYASEVDAMMEARGGEPNPDFAEAKTKLMLAACDWRRQPTTEKQLLLEVAIDYLNAVKVKMIKAHIEADRAASHDGMTSWDRVEQHRLKFGHLPQGNKTCEICEKEKA